MADPSPVTLAVTPASPPVKQLLTLDIGDGGAPSVSQALAAPDIDLRLKDRNSPEAPDVDFGSPAYREKLATALRWDTERQEPYLQLPSFPHLRVTPFREGIEDDIVTLFNHPDVGKRLYRLPYPMKRPYAEKWVQADLHKHVTFLTALIAGVAELPDVADAPTTPLEVHHDVIILGLPFKSLWDTREQRIVGDVGMSPDLEPLTEGGPTRTEDQVLASPLSSQTWHLGYVLEPAAHGKGIMSELVGVVLESWIRPIMRVENVVAIVEDNNKPSVKVVHKNGFRHVKNVVTDWPEEKGGGKRYSGYYVWQRGGDGSDDERVMRNLSSRRRMATDLDTDDSDLESVGRWSRGQSLGLDADTSMESPVRTPARSPARSPVRSMMSPGGDTRMDSPAPANPAP